MKLLSYLKNLYLRIRLNREVIVSFTSYPLRINKLQPMLNSVFNQTYKPDRIIMWLAEDEFPNKEKDLPDYIRQYSKEGKLQIEWCENLKPHKKYFYAMKKYTNSIIITVDDDLIHENNLIETLLMAHLKFPRVVCAKRTHIMQRNNNKFIKYVNFVHEQKEIIMKPSMQLIATNGAGSLFPPHLLNLKYFDENLIKELAPSADDMWLKAIEVFSDVPVVQIKETGELNHVPDMQNKALWIENNKRNGNDIALEEIRNWADTKFGENYFISKIFEKQKKILYFAPHQDDELLTMGIDICTSLNRGADVHIILCTDGSKSRVRNVLNNERNCPKHEGMHIYDLSLEQFVEARDTEFKNSCISLGIPSYNIHIYGKRANDSSLTVEYAEEIIKWHLEKYGKNSQVCTIYYDNGDNQHKDHKNLGLAAHNLFKQGKIKQLKFFKEPYCTTEKEFSEFSAKSQNKIFSKINSAIASYSLWKPEEKRFAIGYHSVTNEFELLKSTMTTYYFEIKK